MTFGPASRVDALRTVPLLADLHDDVMDRLATMAVVVDVVPGTVLMREGEEADGLYVVLGGRLEVTKRMGPDDLPVGVIGPGEVVGEMALLEQGPRSATVRAVEPGRTLFIARDAFLDLVATDSTVSLALVHTLGTRLRSSLAMLQQREKLASLGTLAAGLAHELNNPTAAMRRSAALLRDAFAELGPAEQGLAGVGLDDTGRSALEDVRAGRAGPAEAPSIVDPLAASDRAQALESYLDGLDVADAWRLAPALAERGWTAEDLETLGERVGVRAIGAAAGWLAAVATIDGLIDEIAMTSERIAELVTAVKSYTYLDQAPVQDIDVREGIENTLVIMRHKLKDGTTVVRDYAEGLPRIEAYGSELNQVWTNIVDNAIDAMDGHGTLTIRLRAEPVDHVTVDLCDDGPGIPEPVRQRIFEPFYTTKEPGKGTGLGLHISHSIIVGQHGGQISVTSEPGATCFHVTLPVTLSRR